MTEPAVTITNFLLASECWTFVILLQRVNDTTRVIYWFGWLFALLCAAAILGGVTHGFITDTTGLFFRFVWTSNLVSLGAAGVATAMIATKLAVPERRQGPVKLLLAAAFLIYVLVVLFVTMKFVIAIAATLPSVGFLMIALLKHYRKTTTRGILFAIGGLALTLLGGVQQQLQLGIDPVQFNHNAVYHVIQIVAFLLLFLGAVPTAESLENLGRQQNGTGFRR